MGMYAGMFGAIVLEKGYYEALRNKEDEYLEYFFAKHSNIDGLYEIGLVKAQHKIYETSADTYTILFACGARHHYIQSLLEELHKNAISAYMYFNTEYDSGERIFIKGSLYNKFYNLFDEHETANCFLDYYNDHDGEYVFDPEDYCFGYVTPAKWYKLNDWN